MVDGDGPNASIDDIARAPETLPAVIPAAGLEAEVIELKPRFDQVADENFKLKADIAKLNQRLSTKAAIDSILGPYSKMVFYFLCFYTALSFMLLFFTGFHVGGFALSDELLKVVVGSTAVSAIGLVGLVIRGIFGALQKD